MKRCVKNSEIVMPDLEKLINKGDSIMVKCAQEKGALRLNARVATGLAFMEFMGAGYYGVKSKFYHSHKRL